MGGGGGDGLYFSLRWWGRKGIEGRPSNSSSSNYLELKLLLGAKMNFLEDVTQDIRKNPPFIILLRVLKIKSFLFCMSADGCHKFTISGCLLVEKIKNKVLLPS